MTTRELFLLAVLWAHQGWSLERGSSIPGVLHVPRALTPGSFALHSLLPWGHKTECPVSHSPSLLLRSPFPFNL